MDEYINREDVFQKAKSSISVPTDNEWDCGYNTAMAEMKEFIKKLPAADVQLVKHGRWVECCNELDKKCSCCDKVHGTIYEKEPFCPNCGADMEGDSNDD